MGQGTLSLHGCGVEAGDGVYSVWEGKQADWIFYFLR